MIGKKEVIDGVPLVIGTMTLLKQFHFEYRNKFLEIISQYIRSIVELYSLQKTSDIPVEVVNILNFVEEFVYYSRLDRKVRHSWLIFYIYFLFDIYLDN
jgi:WASH complex subunit strumpellin